MNYKQSKLEGRFRAKSGGIILQILSRASLEQVKLQIKHRKEIKETDEKLAVAPICYTIMNVN